jgi:hypothetical protein
MLVVDCTKYNLGMGEAFPHKIRRPMVVVIVVVVDILQGDSRIPTTTGT